MINERHIRGIEARGLSVETATRMGAYSGKRLRDGSVAPDPSGNILCFPFYEYDEEVNTKHRWSEDGVKKFSQVKDGKKTVYNANVLLDEDMLTELETDAAFLIWTEGEFDCWTAIEAGYPHTVSVPDGAMPGRDAKGRLIEVPYGTDDIDPEDDDKFLFMGMLMQQIMRVKTHVMALDNDDSGRRMAKELVRRIGPARCRFVVYPDDPVVPNKDKKTMKSQPMRPVKDLNEVLLYFGPDKVREILENTKPWPVKGLFKLSDYPDQEMPVMHELGIAPQLDELIKFYTGAFLVGTGVPNAGKSTLINQIAVNMAKIHKWPIAIFSGEKQVKPFLMIELMTAFLGKARKDWSYEDRMRAQAFVERYFTFIDHDPRLDDGEDIDLDYLLDTAAASVFRYGTKMLLIDPWNELEHKVGSNTSLTQYTGDAIRKIKRFGKSFDCMTAVIAHPTKMQSGATPGLYDISDSAHWANKADLGFVVHTDDPTQTRRTIRIPKIRLKGIAGQVGECELDFDPVTQLFKPLAF